MSAYARHRNLTRLSLGVLMIAIGIGTIGIPTLVDSIQLIANAKIQWGGVQTTFKEPLTITLQLRYANGERINASSPLPRYSSDAGKVFGINGTEISLTSGTELLWGGSVHDSQGAPAASIDLGLFYFVAREGCDETRNLSCYTVSNLVARTKTNPDGSFGFQGQLPQPHQDFPAWNLPRTNGKVIIVYADFLTTTTRLRLKTHYALKPTEPPAVLGLWINGNQIVDFGRNVQYESTASNVTFTLRLEAIQQAYLFIGRCGDQACHDTPPHEAILTRQIGPNVTDYSTSVSLDPSYYVFYVLTMPTNPFGSDLRPDTVLAIGIFDTLHTVMPNEYQLLGLVPVSIGVTLLISIPFDPDQQWSAKGMILSKIRNAVRKNPLKTTMALAALSRGFVLAVGLFSVSVFGERSLCQYCWDIDIPLISLFSRWDSGYYVDIAMRGYSSLITPQWEFFPLYPSLMGVGRLLAVAVPIPADLAVHSIGFVVSNLSFFGSVYYLYKLSTLVLRNAELATFSALSLAFYPAGVFLTATYSDSLFLLLTLISLYYWRMGRPKTSAALGFLAALTRLVGIFLAIPYLIELLYDRSRRRISSSYLPIVSPFLGFLAFMAFSQLMTGTPFATFEAERLYWGVTLNLQTVYVLAYNDILGNPIILPYFALALGGILTSILSSKSKAETALDWYALVLLASYLFAPLISFPRYTITLVPAYWGYARWSQRAGSIVFAIFLVLLAIGVGLFVNWYSFY